MRSVKIALAVGLGITALAIGVVLSQSPLTVAATNSVATEDTLATTNLSVSSCQVGERLPAGTVAIRLSLGAFTGPRVTVKALAGNRVVTSGQRGSGWDGLVVTVPVKAVSQTISPVSICFAFTLAGDEVLTAYGTRAGPAATAHRGNGEGLKGRVRIDYLKEGQSSWLALVPSVAKRMGLGRAWSGTGIVFLVLVLMLASTVLASRLILRELHE